MRRKGGWRRPPVRNRRNDALASLDPAVFERVVADYYRGQGYRVEHTGTGGGAHRFDGGIDLKLYRGGEYTIVQCKRENAFQVTHKVGHELLGILLTQKADRAIVVNAGEFTPYAWESAAKEPRLQLIDGDRLRQMLPQYAAPVVPARPESEPHALPHSAQPMPPFAGAWEDFSRSVPNAGPSPGTVRPPEDEARTPYRRRRGRRARRGNEDAGRALVAAIVVALVLWQCSVRRPEKPSERQPAATHQAPPTSVPQPPGAAPAAPARPRPESAPQPVRPQRAAYAPTRPTPEEQREAQRKADEAIRVIEPHTPEFVPHTNLR